jgi:hypothetical protein
LIFNGLHGVKSQKIELFNLKKPSEIKALDDVHILGDRKPEALYAVMQNLLSSGFSQMLLFLDALFRS